MAQPLVITAAITGSVTTREQSPALPLSWEEIAQACVDCAAAGASIIHVHARDEHGTPTQDVDVYAKIVQRAKDSGCEAILNLSTGSAGGHCTDYDGRIAVLALDPEMATLDCGSMNFGDERVFSNSFAFLRRAAAEMQERGTVPEIEVFDAGMIVNGLRLIDEGLIAGPGVWQVCVGVRGGAAGDLQSISHLLSRLPGGAFWSILGVGRHQLPGNLVSIAFGGHVRTGLEDNVFYRPGELASGNVQLVERIVALGKEAGRPIATPDEARAMTGIAAV
jgi:3-keto-5-aminohexanoate cleavage enzyme